MINSFRNLLAAITFFLCLVTTAGEGFCSDALDRFRIYKGMKVPPLELLQKMSGDEINPPNKFNVLSKVDNIPGFIETTSGSIANHLHVKTGFIDDTPVLLVIKIHPDFSQEIIDVQVLPKDKLEWQLTMSKKSKNIVFNDKAYHFSDACFSKQINQVNKMLIVGLAKPKAGKEYCSQQSSDVLKAWQIDGHGHLNEVSTNGINCSIITMYDCS